MNEDMSSTSSILVSPDPSDIDIMEEATNSYEIDEEGIPENGTDILETFKKIVIEIRNEIKNDPDHGYLMFSILLVIVWAVYIILYNSRIQGHILTVVLKRFFKSGDIKIGSMSISLLWGKLLFRDIVYVTEDYSIRIVDAVVQFHYWLPYVKKIISEDMSKCEHRMWIELNGPELHIFNRSKLYSDLEEKFGLDPQIIPKKERNDEDDCPPDGPVKDMKIWSSWRDLIPVIKVELNMARLVIGNRLIPSTLVLTMDKAEGYYSTKPAASSQDFFMHVFKSKAENFRVIMAPSPKYTGILDEPPRYMGEGFVVMSSNKVQFYYYMDEPGIVPAPVQDLLILSPDPDLSASQQAPVWGLDIKCEKGTNLSYGPWADRQREQLFKFFFPQDYQTMEIARSDAPGEIRRAHQFDIRLSILQEATVDILFTKEKETNAVHMTCQKGTYFEMTLPWIVKKEGYIIRINGQFLYLDASTSLQYRNLFEAESFKYEINVKFPLVWNAHQTWDMIFQGSKVSYHFLYYHKQFFHDLIEDWSSKERPDIMKFVPYTWHFHCNFKLFEIITLANEYNWVDCSSQQHSSNAHVAVCGDLLDLKFDLPGVNFLPEVVPLKFNIVGEILYLSLFIPPSNTTSNIIATLDSNAKYENDTRKIYTTSTWRKICKLGAGWIDCWHVPESELTLGYTYHPMPPLGPTPQANVSTPEKMAILLSPIRAPNRKKSPMTSTSKVVTSENFDPMIYPADTFHVQLTILQPSEIKLYGSILRHFIHLKESIFGEDQKFIDMSEPNPYEQTTDKEPSETAKKCTSEDEKVEEFDGRNYRPFEVTVFIDIRNVKGHLMKDCTESDPPCPALYLDRLIFEMNKQYQETQMQVVLSPLILTTSDITERALKHRHLQTGFVILSGFQMRGHAMFSDEGRSPSEETLEYSWLVELTVGSLRGKLTTPQLQHVITGLETFLFTALDAGNCMKHPRPYNVCYHGQPQPECSHTLPEHYCPTIDVIKYKMLRLSVDAIDFHLVEAGTDFNLIIFPIRLATCNLHGQHTRSGVTVHIENISLKNYVCGWSSSLTSNPLYNSSTRHSRHSKSSEGGNSSYSNGGNASSSKDIWLEAAVVNLGPVYIDAAVSSNILHHDMQLIQHRFLKKHDIKTKCLWFLWPQDQTKISSEVFGKCGCVGGCNFIGANRNGSRFFKPSTKDFSDCLNVAQFRVNAPGESPGYGQSLLHGEQLVFDPLPYKKFTHHQFGGSSTDAFKFNLSSGYNKTTSPSMSGEGFANRSGNLNFHQSTTDSTAGKSFRVNGMNPPPPTRTKFQSSHNGHPISSSYALDKMKLSASEATNRIGVIGESSSLGRTCKDIPVTHSLGRTNKEISHSLGRNIKDTSLSIPPGECLTSPGSLSDIRSSGHDEHEGKLNSSLSLQTELPSHHLQEQAQNQKNSSPSATGPPGTPYYKPDTDKSSITSKESDPLGIFHRTVSCGSEALSEAFYSADEDQYIQSRRGTSVSPTLSQMSLPSVPEGFHTDNTTKPPVNGINGNGLNNPQDRYIIPVTRERTDSSASSTSTKSNSTTSSCPSNSSSSGTCDYRSGNLGHSQTSLLHSSDSDVSSIDELCFNHKPKNKSPRVRSDDFCSERASVSSNSFISAVSSQEDIALVNLHMQLNKPITESPLLMSSYINHMTQMHCSTWDAPSPSFENTSSDRRSSQNNKFSSHFSKLFEKISEGFTAIRMVEGNKYIPTPKSPLIGSNDTPNHPYSWDTPVFTWGDHSSNNEAQEESEEIIGGNGLSDSNITKTTVVIKLKKEMDLMISPIALESTQRFLDALTPVMETLHPLTVVNRIHFKSVGSVEAKNTLKKDRYMYWSRIRTGNKAGTPPEQSPVVSSIYQESCFQKVQGQLSIPRVNFTLLQASVVEEIISFSALDNIKDLTCVSLFCFCLDDVNLQFYSGHQSNQSVQIFMQNPKFMGKPKKSKTKIKQNVDLFAEPVYIETSEKQQEENMISVSVKKLHVQLRRLKNESSLLKDASITSIPNHRSKVMFSYQHCQSDAKDLLEGEIKEQRTGNQKNDFPDESRMGFIMFEAGLENITMKAVKRKGFNDHIDSKPEGGGSSRGGSATGVPLSSRRGSTQNPLSTGNAGASGSGTNRNPTSRTISAPPSTGLKNAPKACSSVNMTSMEEPLQQQSSSTTMQAPLKQQTNNVGPPSSSGTSGATTAPPMMSPPFYMQKGTPPDSKEPQHRDINDHSTSPSSSATAHSIGGAGPQTHGTFSVKEDYTMASKIDKKDITSFFVELSTVWLNFAAPPHTPITKKIDYTRLDWNFLSTASPSINAWMNPSDRLTVAVIHFFHSTETRRLGVTTSLMAEALHMPNIHLPPKTKFSKLNPMSQTVQEDPSCQLCNVLRRYVAQSNLKHIESNLQQIHLPKLATLRQGVVVLSRQWKSALYMPLLMEQTFKYKQSRTFRPTLNSEAMMSSKLDPHKVFEEKFPFHDRDSSPLSNIVEGTELKEGFASSEREEGTEGLMSSISSHLPVRHSLPSFPPRSSTASVTLPPTRNHHHLDSPPRRFHFPKFGMMFEETINFFRGISPNPPPSAVAGENSEDWKEGSVPVEMPEVLKIDSPSISKKSLQSAGDHSLESENEEEVGEIPKPTPEDLYKWMAKQQEHTLQNKPTVTFNKGMNLPTLNEGSDGEEQDEMSETNSTTANVGVPKTPTIFEEPQPAHFLEAHVIFEPLLSAIGVITQQISGGALEQLGSNISITASIETLRMDIIESEASLLNRKKRKTGLTTGKFFLDTNGDVPAFICEKIGLEIDICKVPDETRSWVCQQPTLFVSRSALKQHTSTMVHFSLNVQYIALQVNMPLLRLLHQISSMYKNARQTQMGLKERRPTTKSRKASLPQHSKDSVTESHDPDIKTVECSLSEEQGTMSSKGGVAGAPFKANQRDSVESSLSNRASSPSQGTFNRLGRPQSFSQMLKSSAKMSKGKGYMNLVREREKGANSPLLSISGGSAVGEAGSLGSDKSPLLGEIDGDPLLVPTVPQTPKCWRNIYYLVDLYATTPETKTVQQRSGVGDISDRYKKGGKNDSMETTILTDKMKDVGYLGVERTPLVIFGLAKIHTTKLLATLSGLKLEAEMNAMHSSITFREKTKGIALRSTSELSLTGHIGSSMIVLLEGIAPNQQTVVRVTINKSQGLYSSLSRKSKDKNSALITIGPVEIDIPQHPIILHDMMTRGTKQLSTTLQELRVSRPSRLSRGTTVEEADSVPSPRMPDSKTAPEPLEVPAVADSLLHPLAIRFSILLQEMSIHAALLPSLQATYCMQQVSSDGITGSKAKFNVQLPTHHLSFSTRIQDLPSESSLPPSAKIGLPQVRVEAEYILDNSSSNEFNSSDRIVLREGNYLKAVAEIGSLEHSLTTDLLNHLVFVQKVFMKEVNEVVQKMAGSDKPVPLWTEEGTSNVSTARPQRLLFTVQIKLKGIIITATTPTQSAVRLETGSFELQLSNRIENVGKKSTSILRRNEHAKIFGQAHVEITLALGQLIRNELFDEVEPELQQLAYFRTRISLRNAFHDELTSVGDEGEIVLITLTRPLIYIQPLAVDRAVLVWLNYKNAYEYWNEQRATLNKEVLTATQQVFEKVPQLSSLSSAASIKSNLFLKLTVNDIGICLPLNPCRTISHQVDSTETKDALVVTLESTIISACNSGSLVCKAHFQKFCTRFAPEFETSLDEWKPDLKDDLSIINLCMVSEGTYEVCSKTSASHNPDKSDNAKWLLNVQWQMEGVELHLDVNIGKHLNCLARTLTMLTGVPDEVTARSSCPSNEYDSEGDGEHVDHNSAQETSTLPAFIFDQSLGPKQRAKLLEIEMNEQAKTVNDLKTLGASAATIEQEIRRLKELEQIVSSDFRRDMLMKIRRQSIKATSMKDRLGLGPKTQLRSKNFKIPSPTVEVKESSRHCSFGSTDSNPPPTIDELDMGDVFFTSAAESCEGPSPQSSSTEENLQSPLSAQRDSQSSDTSGRRRPPRPFCHSPGIPQGGPGALPLKQTDPTIDLELDVKVNINSGECILYNKDFTKEDDGRGKMKKERSFSGGIHDLPSSPSSIRKKSDMRNFPSSKLKHSTQSSTSHTPQEMTAFFIPGLDVKVHYESHNIHEDTPISGGKGGTTTTDSFASTTASSGWKSTSRENTKKNAPGASPYKTGAPTWSSEDQITIERPLPRPMFLNTNPGPNYATNASPNVTAGSSNPRRIGTKRASLFTWLTLQSIPEETMISPSILDFMEKVLEPIPEPSKNSFSSPIYTEPEMIFNLDMDSNFPGGVASGGYSYASFPVDVIVYFHMQPSAIRFSCQPISRVECLLKLPSLNVVFSSKRADKESGFLDNGRFPSTIGGLSVTGALEDFSLFVFHPYGGKHHRGQNSAPSRVDAERKDSLSVMVEFVKFNIARSRKIHFKQENIKLKSGAEGGSLKAVIRFSTIIDIGCAVFKYDMRRLQEILAFPKAWYRRAIVRRLFLGDMTSRTCAFTNDASPSSADSNIKRNSTSSTEINNGMTPTGPPNMAGSKVDNTNWKKLRIGSTESEGENPWPNNSGSWETLVQFAVSFTKLNVHMNIGNVMGNALFTTNDFKANGRLSIGSTGHKNLYIGLGLGGSCMEAKGGIVGGTLDLTEINMYLKIREDPYTEPDHVIGIKLFAAQARLDYMGTSVLMGRVSSFSVTLKDEWKLKQCATDEQDSTRRGATIFILGDLEWDQLQFLISKSTTADILKMHHKLEEFFTAQFKSSKRVFSSLQTTKTNKASIKSKHREPLRKPANGVGQDARHHRHWQNVLSRVSGLRLTTIPLPLPKSGTVLGGSIELHGKTIFLACFHGINFKSKSWALFSLKEPYINFTSEVQEIPSEGDTHIAQNLTFSLGVAEQNHAQHVSMAKVCRITRNMVFPPQFRSIQEWFHYAFCISDLDDVNRFPSLDATRTDSLTSTDPKRSTSKLQEHNHSCETIFALPSMEVHLNTKHRQRALTPDITDHKPTVECSFVTEFQDHIFVAIDAENFFFLHDLINSYVKDTKDKMASKSKTSNPVPAPDAEDKEGGKKCKVLKVNDPTQILQQDFREFTCPTWHLEPTVRLLSWATRNLEPYGVDYILNKLGFHHARTTIPKWLQRGCMDPLDKILSVLMHRMIQAIHDHDAANK